MQLTLVKCHLGLMNISVKRGFYPSFTDKLELFIMKCINCAKELYAFKQINESCVTH